MLNIIPQVQPRPISNLTTAQKIGDKVGKFLPDKISHTFEMDKMGTLGRIPLLIIALIFVLGARFVKSRDEHERREVLTRDGITVGAAMVAVPVVKNWMQRGVDALSKIPTATERDKIFSLNDFKLDNLANWYGKANLMPEKALSIAKNITERKGDLKKAFSTLGEEGMQHITTMLAGKECTSANILEALKNAHNSTNTKMKNAFESFTKILSNTENGLVKSAQRLKAIPSFASILFVTLLLGWGIPAFNIRLTRKKLKHHQHHVQHHSDKPNSTNKDAQKVNTIEPTLSDNQKAIISSFLRKS